MLDYYDIAEDIGREYLTDINRAKCILEALRFAFDKGEFFRFEVAKRFARELEDAISSHDEEVT